MWANIDRTPGVRLITDPVGGVATTPVRDAVEDALFAALEPERDGVHCLLSRLTAGLGVQLLVQGNRAFITVALNGETETFEVPGDKALDAFDHPYAYGATLEF